MSYMNRDQDFSGVRKVIVLKALCLKEGKYSKLDHEASSCAEDAHDMTRILYSDTS